MYKNIPFWFSCLVLALFLAGCERQQPTESFQKIIRPVRYQQVFSKGGTGQTRSFAGVTKAGVESKLSFKVSGTVDKLLVKAGDEVRAGQLIASLDPTDFHLKVQEAEAVLAQAQAKSRVAQENYDRVRQLYEHRNATLEDLASVRSNSESARAAVRSASKRLEVARLQLSYTRLNAAQNCDVTQVLVDFNETVTAGQPIVTVNCGDQIEVQVAMPENLIGNVLAGDRAMVSFDILENQKYVAEVSEVGISNNHTTTTFPVTVQLREGDRDIRPGIAAEVEFYFNTHFKRAVIIVPAIAVNENHQGQRFVYVVKRSDEQGLGTIHRRLVEVGQLTSEGLEILEGLENGERVVIAGFSQLHEGLTVRFSNKREYSQVFKMGNTISHTIYPLATGEDA